MHNTFTKILLRALFSVYHSVFWKFKFTALEKWAFFLLLIEVPPSRWQFHALNVHKCWKLSNQWHSFEWFNTIYITKHKQSEYQLVLFENTWNFSSSWKFIPFKRFIAHSWPTVTTVAIQTISVIIQFSITNFSRVKLTQETFITRDLCINCVKWTVSSIQFTIFWNFWPSHEKE